MLANHFKWLWQEHDQQVALFLIHPGCIEGSNLTRITLSSHWKVNENLESNILNIDSQ